MENIKKLTIFLSESLIPANHGGKIDILNRIKGFCQLGLEIQLVIWTENLHNHEAEKVYLRTELKIENVHYILRQKKRAIFINATFPARMLTYTLSKTKRNELTQEVKKFSPDLLWVEGWTVWLMPFFISKQLNTKLIYRSHNVETEYIKGQFLIATGIFKWKLFLIYLQIKKTEIYIRANSHFVFDISVDDNNYWKNQPNSTILYPSSISENSEKNIEANDDLSSIEESDILFTGNLWTPNNVNGLIWFLDTVYTYYKDKFGQKLKIRFAGSLAVEKIIDYAEKYEIEIIHNPKSVLPYYQKTKMLINPVQFSSGINIKNLEMLDSQKPIILSKHAYYGFPADFKGFFYICSNEIEFAEQINRILTNEINEMNFEKLTQMKTKYFGIDSLKDALKKI